ncbi:hypothetical protein K1719_038141 [Acacia pycnantha]|nr:hypothetical protein K1719_038141 [Acacia pycnantha]
MNASSFSFRSPNSTFIPILTTYSSLGRSSSLLSPCFHGDPPHRRHPLSGVFHLTSPCIVDRVQDPQRKELLDPAIKGTINVLTAAKEVGVSRVVLTSSISSITPSPKWPYDVIKNEDCWTDIEYCKEELFLCLNITIAVFFAPKKGGKAPVAATKKKQDKVVNPLFEKRPKQFGIGGALPPKRDLTRFVKWPKTVQIQRKKRILKQRLKVPPALNQFTKTLDKNLVSCFGIYCSEEYYFGRVKNEDKLEFSKILEAIKANFNDKYDEYRKKWGGGIMGSKSQARTKAKERLLAKEAAQRMT